MQRQTSSLPTPPNGAYIDSQQLADAEPVARAYNDL
jgi:hypothetical protein